MLTWSKLPSVVPMLASFQQAFPNYYEIRILLPDGYEDLRRTSVSIENLTEQDTLTGLPNRAMCQEYLNHVIAHARRNQSQFALLFLDIDDFKRINDTLGHETGDTLLQEVTQRLASCLRSADYVARMIRNRRIDTLKTEHAKIVAIIAKSHILKLRVVAEGIEEEDQLRLLADRDCDIVQGYFFSRPLPAEEVAPLLVKPTFKTA